MRKRLSRRQAVRLEAVERAFARWRSAKQGRRIPEGIWGAAVRLVTAHGLTVCRVSRRLRLNPGDMKRRVVAEGAAPGVAAHQAPSEPRAKFARIELPSLRVPADRATTAAVRVRIEGVDGVMIEAVLPGKSVSSLIRGIGPLLA